MRNTSGHMISVYLKMSKKGLQFMYCGKKFPNKVCGLALNFLGTLKPLVNNGKLSLLNLNHHHLALLSPCSPHSDSTTHATATILFAMASRPSLLCPLSSLPTPGRCSDLEILVSALNLVTFGHVSLFLDFCRYSANLSIF